MSFKEKFQRSETQKTFKNFNLKREELNAEIIDGKRYYTTPNGIKYPSVTSVLSEGSKEFLQEWREKIGVEEANKITKSACVRGTSVHAIAEKYLLNNQNYAEGAMPTDIYSFNQIKQFLDTHIQAIIGIEYPLYSHTLRTAGRTDLVAAVNSELVIIDFKTAKRHKKEEWVHNYFLQATCYGMMFNDLINTKIKQFYILIATDEDGVQIFNKNMIDYEEEVIHIFTTRN